MKHMLRSLVFVGALVAVLLIAGPASAGGGFSNRDIQGEYIFTLSEIHQEYDYSVNPPIPVLDYCEMAGTLTADGIGMITVAGTRRCSFTGTGQITPPKNTLNYSVSPDGSFTAYDPADPNPGLLHGQIVEHGRSLLLDGTTMTNPDSLLLNGVAMKR